MEERAHRDAALRPRRDVLATYLPGGISALLGGHILSVALRAGHERTARIARGVAHTLASLPESVAAQLPGIAPLGARADAVATRLDALLTQRDETLAPQRAPLAVAVDRAVFELREGLAQMDARLRANFSPAFIESLYPELSRSGRAVAADDDPNDDDSDPPAPPVA